MAAPWWIADSWNRNWSKEEARAYMRGWLIVIPSFLVIYWPVVLALEAVGTERSISTILAITATLPLAFYASHRLCNWLWSDLFEKAAKNAQRRQGKA